MKVLFFHQLTASVLTLTYLVTQCIGVHATETNFWKQRQFSSVVNERKLFPPQSENLNAFGKVDTIESGFSFLSPFANIQKVLTPNNKSVGIVFHIQDIHGFSEAQTNISILIEKIINTYPQAGVGLEGATGSILMDQFRGEKPDVNAQVGKYLLENKIITGAEAAGFFSSRAPRFFGVEDPELYINNFKALKKSLRSQVNVLKEIANEKEQLDRRKLKYFSPLLLALEKTSDLYRDEKIKVGDYLNELNKYLPLSSSSPGFPTANLFLKTWALEKNLDFNLAQREQLIFLNSLASHVPEEELAHLKKLSTELKLGRLSYPRFHEILRELSHKYKISLHQTPEFDKYSRYVLLADDIDPALFLSELSAYENEIWRHLCLNDEQRQLWLELFSLNLVQKMVLLKMSPDEWKTYQLLKIKRGGSVSSFEEFYSFAEYRNKTMAENFVKEIREKKDFHKTISVLVTGGFHSHGIDRFLLSKNFTVVPLTPKLIKEFFSSDDYFHVFTQDRTPLERLFTTSQISLVDTLVTKPIGNLRDPLNPDMVRRFRNMVGEKKINWAHLKVMNYFERFKVVFRSLPTTIKEQRFYLMSSLPLVLLGLSPLLFLSNPLAALGFGLIVFVPITFFISFKLFSSFQWGHRDVINDNKYDYLFKNNLKNQKDYLERYLGQRHVVFTFFTIFGFTTTYIWGLVQYSVLSAHLSLSWFLIGLTFISFISAQIFGIVSHFINNHVKWLRWGPNGELGASSVSEKERLYDYVINNLDARFDPDQQRIRPIPSRSFVKRWVLSREFKALLELEGKKFQHLSDDFKMIIFTLSRLSGDSNNLSTVQKLRELFNKTEEGKENEILPPLISFLQMLTYLADHARKKGKKDLYLFIVKVFLDSTNELRSFLQQRGVLAKYVIDLDPYAHLDQKKTKQWYMSLPIMHQIGEMKVGIGFNLWNDLREKNLGGINLMSEISHFEDSSIITATALFSFAFDEILLMENSPAREDLLTRLKSLPKLPSFDDKAKILFELLGKNTDMSDEKFKLFIEGLIEIGRKNYVNFDLFLGHFEKLPIEVRERIKKTALSLLLDLNRPLPVQSGKATRESVVSLEVILAAIYKNEPDELTNQLGKNIPNEAALNLIETEGRAGHLEQLRQILMSDTYPFPWKELAGKILLDHSEYRLILDVLKNKESLRNMDVWSPEELARRLFKKREISSRRLHMINDLIKLSTDPSYKPVVIPLLLRLTHIKVVFHALEKQIEEKDEYAREIMLGEKNKIDQKIYSQKEVTPYDLESLFVVKKLLELYEDPSKQAKLFLSEKRLAEPLIKLLLHPFIAPGIKEHVYKLLAQVDSIELEKTSMFVEPFWLQNFPDEFDGNQRSTRKFSRILNDPDTKKKVQDLVEGMVNVGWGHQSVTLSDFSALVQTYGFPENFKFIVEEKELSLSELISLSSREEYKSRIIFFDKSNNPGTFNVRILQQSMPSSALPFLMLPAGIGGENIYIVLVACIMFLLYKIDISSKKKNRFAPFQTHLLEKGFDFPHANDSSVQITTKINILFFLYFCFIIPFPLVVKFTLVLVFLFGMLKISENRLREDPLSVFLEPSSPDLNKEKIRLSKILEGLKDQNKSQIPKVIVISDIHGQIERFDEIILNVMKSAQPDVKLSREAKLTPDQPLFKQLKKMGFETKRLKRKLLFHINGDLIHFGDNSLLVVERVQELVEEGLADFIVGNHELEFFLNFWKYHFPIEGRYSFDSYKDGYEQQWGAVSDNLTTLSEKSFNWAKFIAQYQKHINNKQKGEKRENGIRMYRNSWDELAQSITRKKGLYRKIIKESLIPGSNQESVWLRFIGNSKNRERSGLWWVEGMSLHWWRRLLEDFIKAKDEVKEQVKYTPKISSAWEEGQKNIEKIVQYLEGKLDKQLNAEGDIEGLSAEVDDDDHEGEMGASEKIEKNKLEKMAIRVLEAIHYLHHSGAENDTQKKVFHWAFDGKKGKSILEVLKAGKSKKSKAKNYFKNKSLEKMFQFIKENFYLVRSDVFGTYLHAFLPLDENGQFNFTYKGINYRGNGVHPYYSLEDPKKLAKIRATLKTEAMEKGILYPSIYEGLDLIAKDIRDSNQPGDVFEAIELLLSWYSKENPVSHEENVVEAIAKFGIHSLLRRNGLNRLFLGHTPIDKFFPELSGGQGKLIEGYFNRDPMSGLRGIVFSDFGAKDDLGGYVELSAHGIHPYAFVQDKGNISLVPNPIIQRKDKGTYLSPSVASKSFLKSLIKEIEGRLNYLSRLIEYETKVNLNIKVKGVTRLRQYIEKFKTIILITIVFLFGQKVLAKELIQPISPEPIPSKSMDASVDLFGAHPQDLKPCLGTRSLHEQHRRQAA
ncbi:MAG: metallophosphoesterase [Elusimicrobiota bacterium]